MSLSDIAVLLGYINLYDLRVQVDELKVRAWAESLNKAIDLAEAKNIVVTHYAASEVAITVSHINREYSRRVKERLEKKRSQQISEEYDRAAQNKATPEAVERYMAQIREALNRGKKTEDES
jgi:hypothetical protein